MADKRRTRPGSSNWRSVRMPQHHAVARTLQQNHSLRLHGLLIGSLTLALMWGVSTLQKVLGMDSLALRYLVTLTVGYLAYLLVLRLWAALLLRRQRRDESSHWSDGIDLLPDIGWPGGRGGGPGGSGVPLPRTGGGDFAGGVHRENLPKGWAPACRTPLRAAVPAPWATWPAEPPTPRPDRTRAPWW